MHEMRRSVDLEQKIFQTLGSDQRSGHANLVRIMTNRQLSSPAIALLKEKSYEIMHITDLDSPVEQKKLEDVLAQTKNYVAGIHWRLAIVFTSHARIQMIMNPKIWSLLQFYSQYWTTLEHDQDGIHSIN